MLLQVNNNKLIARQANTVFNQTACENINNTHMLRGKNTVKARVHNGDVLLVKVKNTFNFWSEVCLLNNRISHHNEEKTNSNSSPQVLK